MQPNTPHLLVAFDTIDEAFDPIPQHYTIVRPPHGRDFSREELLERLPQATVLCSVFDIPIDRELIDAAPNLELIANYAVGYNNIDIAYCKEKGIAVCNTPESVIAPTAELALALLLSASRRVAEWDRTLRHNGRDLKPSRLDRLGLDLYGKKLGIIGFGNIGQAVAKRCQALGMQVLYYKRNRLSKAQEEAMQVTYRPLDVLCQEADVISLHTPYNPESHHIINAQRLAAMKPHAILVNTARGAVIDEWALVEALQQNRIAAAALDVFEDADKPHPALLTMDRVVMTPHVGTQTWDARYAMGREMSGYIVAHLSHAYSQVAYVVPSKI